MKNKLKLPAISISLAHTLPCIGFAERDNGQMQAASYSATGGVEKHID